MGGHIRELLQLAILYFQFCHIRKHFFFRYLFFFAMEVALVSPGKVKPHTKNYAYASSESYRILRLTGAIWLLVNKTHNGGAVSN